MKHTHLLIPTVLITFLAGCAGKVEPEYPPKDLESFTSQVELNSAWDQGIGDGLGIARYPITPALDDGRLFAADQSGLVRAIDAASGEKIWQVELKTPISSGLTAVAGQVYLGTRNGEVLALDQSDGTELWRSRVSSEVLAPPQANRRLLVIQSVDGAITALDRESGAERWVYTANQPALTLRGTGTPQVIEQVTFAGFANGRLVTLDNRSGQPLWDMRVAVPKGRSEVGRLTDLDGQPVLTQDGRLYVTSYNGRLLALEATSGEILWSREESSYLTPLLIDDTLITVNDASHVLALDALSGRLLWESDALEGRWLTSPAFADGDIALGDYKGYVHLLALGNGKLIGRRNIGGDGISLPLLSDKGSLFVLTNDGELNAFNIESTKD